MHSEKILREYSIPHVGLRLGTHSFSYTVDDRFFKAFEGSSIEHCLVNVKLELEKKETLFILNFFIDGVVTVNCDRCTDSFQKEIFGDFQCLVKYKKEDREDDIESDDEILFIPREETHILIADLLYDYIHLCLPMQLVHPDDNDGNSTCNPEVLKYLSNEGAKSNLAADEVDPRWDILKKFKNDN